METASNGVIHCRGLTMAYGDTIVLDAIDLDITSGQVVALLGAMNHPLLALLSMATGALVTGVLAVALKKWRLQSRQLAATA